jgi:DNA invertase Pin-like site-specific DNA recombinase
LPLTSPPGSNSHKLIFRLRKLWIFERSLISERMVAAKAQMRHQGLLQGGKAPFGYKLGELAGHGRTRHLLPDPAQQEAIVTMRGCGKKAPR